MTPLSQQSISMTMLAVERQKASRLFSARHVKCNNQTVSFCRPTAATVTTTTHRHGTAAVADLDVETQLKMMDYFMPGSTEDLVGEHRALLLESWDGTDRQALQEENDCLIHQEQIDYLELPDLSDLPAVAEMEAAEISGSRQIPSNQLAHGAWGEMLIRTERVCKMWRGGRIESYRALLIGGNLRGCGGFGVGKAFKPEDAVEIASRLHGLSEHFVCGSLPQS